MAEPPPAESNAMSRASRSARRAEGDGQGKRLPDLGRAVKGGDSPARDTEHALNLCRVGRVHDCLLRPSRCRHTPVLSILMFDGSILMPERLPDIAYLAASGAWENSCSGVSVGCPLLSRFHT